MSTPSNTPLLPPAFYSGTDTEKKLEKDGILSREAIQTTAMLACFSYCICSLVMTFSNKVVLSSYDFKWPLVLLTYQV